MTCTLYQKPDVTLTEILNDLKAVLKSSVSENVFAISMMAYLEKPILKKTNN